MPRAGPVSDFELSEFSPAWYREYLGVRQTGRGYPELDDVARPAPLLPHGGDDDEGAPERRARGGPGVGAAKTRTEIPSPKLKLRTPLGAESETATEAEPEKPQVLAIPADRSLVDMYDQILQMGDKRLRPAREEWKAAAEAYQRQMEEIMAPALKAVASIAARPTPRPPTYEPPPPAPDLAPRAFLDAGRKQTLPAIVEGLGLLATTIAGAVTPGGAAGGLAALTGAMTGWAEGDNARADRKYRDYLLNLDQIRERNALLRQSWQDAVEANAGDLERAKAMLMVSDAALKVPQFRIAVAEKGMEQVEQDLTRGAALLNALETRSMKLATLQNSHDYQRARIAIELEKLALQKEELHGAPGGPGTDSITEVGARRLIRGAPVADLVKGIGKVASAKFERMQRRATEILRDEQGLTDEEIAEKLTQARQAYTANQRALSRVTEQEAQIVPFTQTAQDSLRRARELSDKIDRTGIPVWNRWIMKGRKEVRGDPDVAAFDYHLRLGINEVAKITSSATGGGGVVSDASRHEIESTLNNAMNRAQIRAVINGAQYEMSSRLRHLAEQKQRLLSGQGSLPVPEPLSGAPDPAAHKGRTMTDQETGKRYESDGTQWVEIGG